MTQDEIIEMARQARMEQDGDMWFSNLYKPDMDVHISHLDTCAKLVAAKEREACAEIAEKQRYAMFISLTSHPAQNGTAVGIANAIRVRGEA